MRGSPALDSLRAAHLRRVHAKRSVALACAAVLVMAPASLRAQNTPPVVTIDSSLTATDNGALSASGSEQSDFVASVRPRFALSRRNAGLKLELDAAATFLGYANGTQQSGVFPELRAALTSTLVERWLYVDAAAQLRQTQADQFGTRADDATGANQRTERSFRMSPYVEREVAPNAWLLARQDAAVTTNGAGAGTRLESSRSVIRLERLPVPFGAAGELTRFRSESEGFPDSRFALDTARVRGSTVLDGQWVLGAIVGVDRSEVLQQGNTDPLYGISLLWTPGPRTGLSANLEHRFFGPSGDVTFFHRLPFMSIALSLSRHPVFSTAYVGLVGQRADLRSLLDGILTTRYPDPETRRGLVDALVTSRGLETRSFDPADVVAEYPQVQTSANATWVILGSRNTATLNVYVQTFRQLTRDGDPLASSTSADSDSRQTGAAFQLSRRLAPQVSADAVVRWSRVTGLAARTGDVSEETTYRLSLVQFLSPRTGLSAGVQYNRFSTNVSGQNAYDATLAFVGLSHRF